MIEHESTLPTLENAVEGNASGAVDNDFLPLDEALTRARACGEEVTVAQLDGWQRYGLLPQRRQLHRPGRAGSTSGYPTATVEQIVTLARLGRTHRRLEERAVAAWLEGSPIPPATARKALASLLARATALPEWTILLRYDQETGEEAEPFEVADAIVVELPESTWRSIALPSSADRGTVVTRLLEWGLGGTPLWAGSGGEAAAGLGEATPQELVGKALQLERSALARWMHADPSKLAAGFDWWRMIGLGAIPDLPAAVQTWTDKETAKVREDINAWQALWRGLGALLPADHGDPLVRELLGMANGSLDELAMLACGLVAVRRSEFGAMLDMVLTAASNMGNIVAMVAELTPDEREAAQKTVWAHLVNGPV